MQAKFKWLFLPPAIALVLFLGPLRQNGESIATAPAGASRTTTPAAESNTRRPTVPATPDMWQVASTLIGVLLLGVAGIAVLKHVRTNRPLGDGEYVRLRQSLRLSPKHTVHAVEFEDRILLIGAADGSVSVLRDGAMQDVARDEVAVTSRRVAPIDDDDPDDGAVPRDMIIPRPSKPPAKKEPTAAEAPQIAAKLANFKSLLARVGAGSS